MAIQYKGKLLSDSQLSKIDVKDYTKMKLCFVDYLLTMLILIIPLICGFRLLTASYSGK